MRPFVERDLEESLFYLRTIRRQIEDGRRSPATAPVNIESVYHMVVIAGALLAGSLDALRMEEELIAIVRRRPALRVVK